MSRRMTEQPETIATGPGAATATAVNLTGRPDPARGPEGPSVERRHIARRVRDFLSDLRGGIAVTAAIIFPFVIGGIGLGVETSFWYMTQRELQHAADLAAHAAAARMRAGDSYQEIRAAATNIAVSSGFRAGQGTVTVNIPPATGPYAGAADKVEVLLSENHSRWFTALFAGNQVKLGGRAVSGIEGGSTACILALSRTESGALTVEGSTQVTLENCDVASNSNSSASFLMNGSSAKMTTGCVYTVGQAASTLGLTLTRCTQIHQNAPRVRDPYANVTEPAVVGPCESGNLGNPSRPDTITPTYNHPSGVKSRRYCNGLDLKGEVTFEPGLYIIEGGNFQINGGNANATAAAMIKGAGVTFYLTATATLVLNGNVTITLSPPTTGPTKGILFFGARNATSIKHLISGSTGSTLQGALYFPASHIQFRGDSTVANGCTQVIGRIVTMSGNSTLRSVCTVSGTAPLKANEGVSLLE